MKGEMIKDRSKLLSEIFTEKSMIIKENHKGCRLNGKEKRKKKSREEK